MSPESTAVRLLATSPLEEARNRLISRFDWETTLPRESLGYRFDIVLRGRNATPMEDADRH